MAQLLCNLFAKQAAEAGRDDGKLRRRMRRLRLPLEEVGEQRYEAVRRGQLVAGGLDIALHVNHRSHKLSIPPEAEAIAVRVDQVGEGLELRPLLLVVRVLEAARIGPLAGCLDLDEADEGVCASDGVVRPRLEIGKRGFANRHDSAARQSREFAEVLDEPFQRRAKLILRCTARTRV